MREILVALVVGVLGSALFSLLLASAVDSLRHNLNRRTAGYLRRRYVRALLEAVRGRAAVSSTYMLTWLVSFTLMVVAGSMFFGARSLEEQMATNRAELESTRASLFANSVTKIPATRAQLEERVRALTRESNSLTSTVHYFSLLANASSAGIIAFVIWLQIVWIPFAIVRATFTHEVHRFALRIQGLASKAELASLTELELRVCDEATLRKYVALMRQIAARHGAETLTSSFELWH